MVTYGCSVWIHNTNFFKLIANGKLFKDTKNTFRRIALDPLERIHLKLLKWSFLVNNKASNLACWGDSGRMPLVIKTLKQSFDYYRRLEVLDQNDKDCLVRHAFVEQRNNGLPWYNDAQNFLGNLNLTNDSSPITIRCRAMEVFEELWQKALQNSSKLTFYNAIKLSIGYEPYLSLKDFRKRKAVAQLRFSNHRLNIETGRYIKSQSDANHDKQTWKKCCKTCVNKDAEPLISLPFFDPIIEDEQHVLSTFPKYEHHRQALGGHIKTALASWDHQLLMGLFKSECIYDFSPYVLKILESHSNIRN